MVNFNKSWMNTKNYLYKHYGQEMGKMILHTGIITWTLATLGQVTSIAFNEKIPKKQKQFLIPQEIADGAINIVAFYAITNSMKNIGSKLVSTGKWSNKSIRDFIKKNPSKKVKMGELSTNLAKTYKGNEDFYTAYSPFNNGIGMITTTIGSVVSCNAIAPFLRNKIGSKQQKKSIIRDKTRTDIYSTKTNTSMKI